MTVIGLIVASMMTDQARTVAFLQDQMNKIEINRNAETILKDRVSCQQSLQGLRVPVSTTATTDLIALRDENGAVVYRSNTIRDNLRLGQMTIQNVSVSAPNSTGFVNISIPLRRTRTGGGPTDLQGIELMTMVKVNAARDITGCSVVANATPYSCLAARNSSCTVNSDPDAKFCALKSYGEAACDTCARFSCQITGPSAAGVWTLRGERGDDGDSTCEMICLW